MKAAGHLRDSAERGPRVSMSTMMKRLGRPVSTDPRRSNQYFSDWAHWNLETLIDTECSFMRAVFNWSDCRINCLRTSMGPEFVGVAVCALSVRIAGTPLSLTRLTISVAKFFVVFLELMLPLISIKEEDVDDAQVWSWVVALARSLSWAPYEERCLLIDRQYLRLNSGLKRPVVAMNDKICEYCISCNCRFVLRNWEVYILWYSASRAVLLSAKSREIRA